MSGIVVKITYENINNTQYSYYVFWLYFDINRTIIIIFTTHIFNKDISPKAFTKIDAPGDMSLLNN